jgi:hypothetical protein
MKTLDPFLAHPTEAAVEDRESAEEGQQLDCGGE